jgi:hypothetical protein
MDLSVQDIIVSILSGEQDAGLVDIGKAIDTRIDDGHVRAVWWVRFEDRTISAASMNILAARYFERNSGVNWEDADPSKFAQRVSLVQAELIEGDDDMNAMDAVKKLRKFKEADITFGEWAQVNPPKDDSASTG